MANFICPRISSTNVRHCDKLLYQSINRPLMQRPQLCRRDGYQSNTKLLKQVCRYRSTVANMRFSSVVPRYCGISNVAPSQCRISLHKLLSTLSVSHNAVLTSQYKATVCANHMHTSAFRLDMNGEVYEKEDGEIPQSCDQMPAGIQEALTAESTHVNPDQCKLDVLPHRRDPNILKDFKQSVPSMLFDIEDEDELDILSERQEPTVIKEFSQPPLLPSSYTLASYVEHSEVLQKLVQLGVNLSKVEKKAGVADKIIKLNFDPQVAEKISFLNYVGVESDNLGNFLTKNPHILLEDQENLEKRVKYLMSKKFDKTAIAQMVNRAPYLLCFSVERIDGRLGFYQRTLQLTGDELRQMITACPRLVTHKLKNAEENLFVLKQQLGFHRNEMKTLILGQPRILTRAKYKLVSIFDYLHNDMGIPHKLIMQNHQVFNSRVYLIQERHKFLESIGRSQYDPTQPGYVSLKRLVTVPDHTFCEEIAQVPTQEYNTFLKTL